MRTQTQTFVNPNNPIRRQAPGSVTQARTAAKTPQVPAKTASRPGQQKTASKNGARSAPVAMPALYRFASENDEQNFDGDGQFNPKRFSGYSNDGALRRAVASKDERIYNSRGEINAYDKKECLAQAAYLLNHVARESPLNRLTRQASYAEAGEMRKVLAQAAMDPSLEGFARIGQELTLPIKAVIDYEGWARKVYRVRSLQQGELFRIAKDVRATAYVVGQDGQSIASRLHGKYIMPDETKITAFAEVDIMELYQMNFDVLDRAQDTARQSIEVQEDKRGLALLDRACRARNTVSSFASVSISVLENLRYQVERHRLIADKYLINRAELSDIQINMSGSLDPVSQREMNLAGFFGRFLGAHIMTCAGTQVEEVVPPGTIYCVTSPEYLGEMGIRIELFSVPYNGLPNRETIKGWAFIESVGFGIANTRSCAKAVKSSS